MFPDFRNCRIGIIGLGYVGLPLAVEFAKYYIRKFPEIKNRERIVGLDINQERINQLKTGLDITKEISEKDLKKINNIVFTNDQNKLIDCNVFLITVPTPINKNKQPDLKPLIEASKTVGNLLKERRKSINKNGMNYIPTIIYESTVFPGATEEICIPIIEKLSDLKLNKMDPFEGFVAGYSPERINPGDKEHSLKTIVKVTSGSNNEARKWINDLYSLIVTAGTFSVKSIKVAEAAKVIENTQRDLNIALINELAIIFEKMNLNTFEVLEAAKTKWNFLDFKPGLVGGHCIGVDPYYLTQKSIELGYIPELVLAGRKINDSMAEWIISLLIKNMAKKQIPIANSNILIMGYTFKENCCDTRNTQVIKLIRNLNDYNLNIYLFDPYIKILDKSLKKIKVKLIKELKAENKFDSIIACLAHREFKNIESNFWRNLCKKNNVIIDLKNFLPKDIDAIKI